VVAWGVIGGTIETVNTIVRILNDRDQRRHEAVLMERRLATERHVALVRGGADLAIGAATVLGSLMGRRAAAARQQLDLAEEREFQRVQVKQAQKFQAELAHLRHESDMRLQERISKLQEESAKERADYQRMLEWYPVARPGHLRKSLALAWRDLSDMPPLVLLPPPNAANSAGPWGLYATASKTTRARCSSGAWWSSAN
jgi:hypothetical protein